MWPHLNVYVETLILNMVIIGDEALGVITVGSHRVGHDWSDLAAAEAAGLDEVMGLETMILAFLIFSFKPALSLSLNI